VLAPFTNQRDQDLLLKIKPIILKEAACFHSCLPFSFERADNGTVSFLDRGHFVLWHYPKENFICHIYRFSL